MRVFTNGSGVTTIDQDEDVVSLITGMDMEAPYWEYVVTGSDEGIRTTDPVTPTNVTVRVDVSSHRPSLDVLSGLYQKAQVSNRPEDAAAYVKHKTRVLALFKKRDVDGQRYE